MSCYGSTSIKTPNLDSLANQGMRFTDYYAGASVCSPSRVALMTGRYPIRAGFNNKKAPNGVYAYSVQIVMSDDIKRDLHGMLTLVR